MTNQLDRLKAALADRYKIERRLGEGGMATVYLAEDIKHDRKVALKVLKPELAAVLGAERFVQEIKTTASLQHPNILPLFDSGEADGLLYYVMPFIEGETLREKLNRETQLSIEEAVQIATDVAEALQAAHDEGVIHRDIKPENVLLHKGRPMVADFGIALAVSAAAGGRMTETGLSLGTPHYMSPEQATAEKDITARSDVYSLGSVLYEMLTGDPPHTGSSAQQIMMKIVTETPRPVTELRKSVPSNVADAVAKALEKLAADRFDSPVAFADAIGNPVFRLPTGMTGTIGDRKAVPWRQLTYLFASVAVATTLLAVWAWDRTFLPPSAVTRHQLMRVLSAPSRGFEARNIAIAPDGSALVFSDTVSGVRQLWIKERALAEATPLAGTSGGDSPFFSPDAAWIGFSAGDAGQLGGGKLKRVARGGGSPVELADDADLNVSGAWLDDGTIVFSKTNADNLLRISSEGGPATSVLQMNDIGRRFRSISALPGGRGVLFVGSSGLRGFATEAWVLDLQTGEARMLVEEVGFVRYTPTGHLVYVRRDGGMFAVEFDLGTLSLRGPAVPIIDNVRTVRGLPDLQLGADGTLLYLTGPADLAPAHVELVWVDRNGHAETVDSNWAVGPQGNGAPLLSPDGTRVSWVLEDSITGLANVFVAGLPAGPLSKLTLEGTNIRSTWSPDGRAIMFASSRAGQFDLWTKSVDGSGSATLLLDVDRPVLEGLWSHDGEWVIYRTDDVAPGRGDILALRPGGDNVPIEVAATEFEETSPALSPDDRWLAYVSTESGRKDVYVRPFPTGGDRQLVSTGEGGTEPVWGSGTELYYRSDATLVAVDVVTTPTFSVRARRPLFSTWGYGLNPDHRDYDVTDDGQRFLMTRGTDRGLGRMFGGGTLILVENFFEELKAKVGN